MQIQVSNIKILQFEQTYSEENKFLRLSEKPLIQHPLLNNIDPLNLIFEFNLNINNPTDELIQLLLMHTFHIKQAWSLGDTIDRTDLKAQFISKGTFQTVESKVKIYFNDIKLTVNPAYQCYYSINLGNVALVDKIVVMSSDFTRKISIVSDKGLKDLANQFKDCKWLPERLKELKNNNQKSLRAILPCSDRFTSQKNDEPTYFVKIHYLVLEIIKNDFNLFSSMPKAAIAELLNPSPDENRTLSAMNEYLIWLDRVYEQSITPYLKTPQA